MELSENHPGREQLPQACTLPTAEQPLRVAAFEKVFAEAVRGVQRAGPTSLLLALESDPAIAGRMAELVTAETSCCSFFTFTLTAASDRLTLAVSVPAAYTGILASMADRAEALSGSAA